MAEIIGIVASILPLSEGFCSGTKVVVEFVKAPQNIKALQVRTLGPSLLHSMCLGLPSIVDINAPLVQIITSFQASFSSVS